MDPGPDNDVSPPGVVCPGDVVSMPVPRLEGRVTLVRGVIFDITSDLSMSRQSSPFMLRPSPATLLVRIDPAAPDRGVKSLIDSFSKSSIDRSPPTNDGGLSSTISTRGFFSMRVNHFFRDRGANGANGRSGSVRGCMAKVLVRSRQRGVAVAVGGRSASAVVHCPPATGTRRPHAPARRPPVLSFGHVPSPSSTFFFVKNATPSSPSHLHCLLWLGVGSGITTARTVSYHCRSAQPPAARDRRRRDNNSRRTRGSACRSVGAPWCCMVLHGHPAESTVRCAHCGGRGLGAGAAAASARR